MPETSIPSTPASYARLLTNRNLFLNVFVDDFFRHRYGVDRTPAPSRSSVHSWPNFGGRPHHFVPLKPKSLLSLTTRSSFVLLAAMTCLCQYSYAATVAWTSSSSTAWYTTANWTPGKAESAWVTTDVAQFNKTKTNFVGINFASRNLSIAGIDITSARDAPLAIGASGGSGTLSLSGKDNSNVILRNSSANGTLTVKNNVAGTGNMSIILSGSQIDHVISIESSSGITISSTISGIEKKIVLQGGGTASLQLLGANTYSGGTSVAGTNQLRIGSDGVVSTGGVRTSSGVGTGTLTLGNGSTLSSDSGAARVIQNDLSLSGTISLGNQNGTLTFNSTAGGNTLTTKATVTLTGDTTLKTNVNTTIDNAINGNYGLTKAGAGAIDRPGSDTLVLTGTNTYTGPTIVNQGKLIVGVGGVGSIKSNVVVNSGGTLGGSGTITGNVSVNRGGTLAAGNSPGLLTVSNNMTLAEGSIFSWELASQTTSGRGTNFDAVDVGGNIEFSNSIFNVVITGLDLNSNFWDATQTWQVFNKGLTAGSGFSSFQLFASTDLVNPVSYGSIGNFAFNSGTGSLVWTAVPEPSSALAGILISIGLFRRRRSAA